MTTHRTPYTVADARAWRQRTITAIINYADWLTRHGYIIESISLSRLREELESLSDHELAQSKLSYEEALLSRSGH